MEGICLEHIIELALALKIKTIVHCNANTIVALLCDVGSEIAIASHTTGASRYCIWYVAQL